MSGLTTKILERDIERELVRAVVSVGGIAYKFTSPQRANVPDRICVFPNGNVVWVEVKRPGAKATEGQTREHQRLTRLNQTVMIVDSFDGARRVVQYGQRPHV